MNISRYVPRGSDLAEEHKDSPYVPLGLANVHKLCTSVFKPRNVFSVMNIGSEKHKKAEERMHFSCSAFNTMVPPVQYQGGDWFMDTGASGHAAYNAGIVYSTRPALSTYHIIIGNGAPPPVQSLGSATIPSTSSLYL
jgi:hypothetical protein